MMDWNARACRACKFHLASAQSQLPTGGSQPLAPAQEPAQAETVWAGQVPSGLLPAMELDGKLVIESADIMWALEEAFPESALLPPEGSRERQRANQLLRLERQLFGDWLRWLCSGWCVPWVCQGWGHGAWSGP